MCSFFKMYILDCFVAAAVFISWEILVISHYHIFCCSRYRNICHPLTQSVSFVSFRLVLCRQGASHIHTVGWSTATNTVGVVAMAIRRYKQRIGPDKISRAV